MANTRMAKHREELEAKLKMLNQTNWEGRVPKNVLEEWVSQFEESASATWDEQAQGLFLLSHFLYFGQEEIRSLLRSLYRDLIRAPALRKIRRAMGDTLDTTAISAEYTKQHNDYRYLALGNPSESSMHLLYYFRQVNSIPRKLFIHPHEIFEAVVANGAVDWRLRTPAVQDYVFLDDMCGSGHQAIQYGRDVVQPLKALFPAARVHYFALFGTSSGLETIRSVRSFDNVEAVYELDESFRTLEEGSRIFRGGAPAPDRSRVRETCLKYGLQLSPAHPLGYDNGQLLLGFNHNTPDNTLPIFWGGAQAETGPWKPIFRRYEKVN